MQSLPLPLFTEGKTNHVYSCTISSSAYQHSYFKRLVHTYRLCHYRSTGWFAFPACGREAQADRSWDHAVNTRIDQAHYSLEYRTRSWKRTKCYSRITRALKQPEWTVQTARRESARFLLSTGLWTPAISSTQQHRTNSQNTTDTKERESLWARTTTSQSLQQYETKWGPVRT